MNLIKRVYESNNDNFEQDRPFVYFSDLDDKDKLMMVLNNMNFLDTDLLYEEVDYNLVEIFNRLGFNNSDSICLHNMKIGSSKYDVTREGYCSFNYSVNSLEYKEGDTIGYYSSNELFDGCEKYAIYPGVKLSSGDESLYYSVGSIPCIRKYSIKLNDEVTLTREYSRNEALFIIEGANNSLLIKIKKHSVKAIDSNYVLDNEMLLLDYLRTLTDTYDVVEIYNKLCEISFGNDISMYQEITVCDSNKIDNSWKNSNLISIKNGEIDSVVRTIGDKTIKLHGNGNWSYVLSDENVDFRIKSGKTFKYSIETKNDKMMDEYTDGLLRYDVSVARQEVEETRELVRKRCRLGNKRG